MCACNNQGHSIGTFKVLSWLSQNVCYLLETERPPRIFEWQWYDPYLFTCFSLCLSNLGRVSRRTIYSFKRQRGQWCSMLEIVGWVYIFFSECLYFNATFVVIDGSSLLNVVMSFVFARFSLIFNRTECVMIPNKFLPSKRRSAKGLLAKYTKGKLVILTKLKFVQVLGFVNREKLSKLQSWTVRILIFFPKLTYSRLTCVGLGQNRLHSIIAY